MTVLRIQREITLCDVSFMTRSQILQSQNNSLCINMQFLHAHLSGFKPPGI